MSYLIGIGLGTSGTKTVLFDASGTAIAAENEPFNCDKSSAYPPAQGLYPI